jgi:transposase
MRLPPLELRPGDREVLEAWTRAATVEARVAKRSRIVLLAADGVSNRQIGEIVDMHYNQVAVWRRRYGDYGLAGLEDEERPGRPFVYTHDDVLLLVKTVTEPPPDSATRWTMDSLAQAMAAHGVGISASQIWRICKGLDLKPWQTQSWMTSHDPQFWEKAADVCGLYLDPPTNAVVWSVDEKTSIQAKARINPTRRAVPGRRERREFEYERHGTAVLFAALNVHQGAVSGWVTDSTCSMNFVTFLWDLMDQTPAHLDLHCIVDNLSAHGTPEVAELLEYNPRVHLHYTPTHASWLNQVELFFSILERRLLRRGEFADVDDLADRIIAFIKDYNRRAAPFRWTYDGRPLQVA